MRSIYLCFSFILLFQISQATANQQLGCEICTPDNTGPALLPLFRNNFSASRAAAVQNIAACSQMIGGVVEQGFLTPELPEFVRSLPLESPPTNPSEMSLWISRNAEALGFIRIFGESGDRLGAKKTAIYTRFLLYRYLAPFCLLYRSQTGKNLELPQQLVPFSQINHRTGKTIIKNVLTQARLELFGPSGCGRLSAAQQISALISANIARTPIEATAVMALFTHLEVENEDRNQASLHETSFSNCPNTTQSVDRVGQNYHFWFYLFRVLTENEKSPEYYDRISQLYEVFHSIKSFGTPDIGDRLADVHAINSGIFLLKSFLPNAFNKVSYAKVPGVPLGYNNDFVPPQLPVELTSNISTIVQANGTVNGTLACHGVCACQGKESLTSFLVFAKLNNDQQCTANDFFLATTQKTEPICEPSFQTSVARFCQEQLDCTPSGIQFGCAPLMLPLPKKEDEIRCASNEVLIDMDGDKTPETCVTLRTLQEWKDQLEQLEQSIAQKTQEIQRLRRRTRSLYFQRQRYSRAIINVQTAINRHRLRQRQWTNYYLNRLQVLYRNSNRNRRYRAFYQRRARRIYSYIASRNRYASRSISRLTYYRRSYRRQQQRIDRIIAQYARRIAEAEQSLEELQEQAQTLRERIPE